MTPRLSLRMKRLATAASLAAGAWLAISCADEVAGPGETVVPFSISAEQRSALVTAVRFVARGASLEVLGDRAGAERIRIAFAGLAERLAANDRGGALRSLESARAALNLYREAAPADAPGLMEIEMMSLTLRHVEIMAAESPAMSLYGSD